MKSVFLKKYLELTQPFENQVVSGPIIFDHNMKIQEEIKEPDRLLAYIESETFADGILKLYTESKAVEAVLQEDGETYGVYPIKKLVILRILADRYGGKLPEDLKTITMGEEVLNYKDVSLIDKEITTYIEWPTARVENEFVVVCKDTQSARDMFSAEMEEYEKVKDNEKLMRKYPIIFP